MYNQLFYRTDHLETITHAQDPDNPIGLSHNTTSNALEGILQLGGIASPQYAHDQGLDEFLSGESSSGGVTRVANSFNPNGVSFWHDLDMESITKSARTALSKIQASDSPYATMLTEDMLINLEVSRVVSTQHGLKMRTHIHPAFQYVSKGFEYPISFCVRKNSMRELNLNKAGMPGEISARRYVPLDTIGAVFVPYFAQKEVSRLFEAHGFRDTEILSYEDTIAHFA